MDPVESSMLSNPPSNGGRWLLVAILVVGGAAIAFAMLLQQPMMPPSDLIGKPAPLIRAEGWLNGPGPTGDDLKGKVIVVDAWAWWCGPCLLTAPETVALYERYRDRGVVFLGLTSEGSDTLDKSRKFVKEARFTFPNGYGADDTLIALKAETIPRLWVIGRDNVIVWDQTRRGHEPLETAIDRALAAKP